MRIRKLADVLVMIDKSIPTTEGQEFVKGMGFLFLKEGRNLRLIVNELDKFTLFQHDDLFVLTRELRDSDNVNVYRNIDLISIEVENEGFVLYFTIHVIDKWVKVERSLT